MQMDVLFRIINSFGKFLWHGTAGQGKSLHDLHDAAMQPSKKFNNPSKCFAFAKRTTTTVAFKLCAGWLMVLSCKFVMSSSKLSIFCMRLLGNSATATTTSSSDSVAINLAEKTPFIHP